MVLPTMAHRVFGANLVFVRMAHRGRGLIFVFQEFAASINKAFILAGGLGAGLSFILWGMDTFLIFPNFLTTFISNNRVSFHLW